ncbi:MAG: class II glutamine amidotransferase [Candidatus Omnitrophica bacterium]|nr:class II glutamine amidotransferase [Candidatus Omnitrophota bacterium]
MSFESDSHECDLFLLSSHHPYLANRALTQFANLGRRNIHGWGIGAYLNGQPNVVKSSDPAVQYGKEEDKESLNAEFSAAIRSALGAPILGHLRLQSRGDLRSENNHPFRLKFLVYEWLLVHNGSSHRTDDLVPHDEQLLVESTCDSARVFEFLRKEIIDYSCADTKHSLIHACRTAFGKLLEFDSDGSYNLILSNGHLSFCLVHWRSFYLLHRDKDSGDTALISTLKLTEDEEWTEFRKKTNKRAKVLVFSGPTLIYNGDI